MAITTRFNDRPGTRIMIRLPRAGPPEPGAARTFFSWTFKLIYSLAAGFFCVALLSYAPEGGPAFAQFVPTESVLFLHAPSGAALHQAVSESPSFNDLLNDSDAGKFLKLLTQPRGASSAESENADNVPSSIRSQIDALWARIDSIPWYARWLAPRRATDLYSILGGECALAIGGPSSKERRNQRPVLILARVNGSRGTLLRLAAPFVPAKKLQIFDLGGGLIALGLNGARPATETHTLPRIISGITSESETPMLRVAADARAWFQPNSLKPDLARNRLERAIDENTTPDDIALARMSEAGVPDAILFALMSPPGIAEILNLSEPIHTLHADVFEDSAEFGGGVFVRGKINTSLPPLQKLTSAKKVLQDALKNKPHEFSEPDVMAEMVLPINAREAFVRHVASQMKLVNLPGLTKGQRRWMPRFRTLLADDVDLDKDLWPALGRVAKIWIHESKSATTGTPLGTIRAWMPFKPANLEDALFAAADLARVRWDFLFENDEKATAKPPYVRRFTGKNMLNEDRFVYATGQINSPAWSIGRNGFRLSSEAGVFALRDGPTDADFPAPPEQLSAYSVKIDGARLASTAEGIATVVYDDIEEGVGNAQKFNAQHPHNALHIRLARKLTGLLGNFDLVVTPETRSAELELHWRAGRIPGSSAQLIESPGLKTESKKFESMEPKKVDEDDAPPPPPPAN